MGIPAKLSCVLAVALFAVAGCGTSESDIVGKWVVDVDATKSQMKDDLKAKNVPSDQIDMAMDSVSMGADMFSFEFKADKTFTGMMGMTGTWKLDGSNVVINGPAGAITMQHKGGKLHFKPDAGGQEAMVLKKS